MGLFAEGLPGIDSGKAESALVTDLATEPGNGVLGDVDCTGSVLLSDPLEVRRWSAGLGPAPGCLAVAGDTDCDGMPTATDALRLMRYVAGLPNLGAAGCPAVGDPVSASPRNSFQLIDDGLANGDIDLGTALLYKAYAGVRDGRLPSIYQGNDSLVQDSPFHHAVLDNWDTLSADEKAALVPYLLPPNLADSWYAQDGASKSSRAVPDDWTSIPAPTIPVRAWYHAGRPGDDVRAASVLSQLEGGTWSSLTGLMGRSPLPDCGASCASGGGDERLDIYIVDPAIRSYVSWNPPESPDCSNVAAFMVLGDTAQVTVAHEFMHVLQFAFDGPSDCAEYRWFAEASAEWTNDYVFPTDNSEHFRALLLMLQTERHLDLVNDSHEYAAYLYPFFLAATINPQVIRDIWQTGESKVPSLVAVNQVTAGAGGFEELWPEFALRNWNKEPVDDYHDWDDLTDGARSQETSLGVGETPLTKSVDYLGATYYSWEFTDDAGYIEFKNSLVGRPHTIVQAIASIDGNWQEPEDWTAEARKTFCRNLPGQDIDRLVLIISNSDWQGKTTLEMGNEPPVLVARNESCDAYVGTASTTWTSANGKLIGTATTNDVRFEFDEDNESLPGSDYWTATGTVHWTYDGTNGDCTISGSGSFSLGGKEGHLFIADPNSDGERQFYASGGRPSSDPPYTATQTCEESTSQIYPRFGFIWLWASVLSDHFVSESGRVQGSEQQVSGSGDIQTWNWSFEPAP